MEEANRLRNESMGTNYTFRDKDGNIIQTEEKPSRTERNQNRDDPSDIVGFNFQPGKLN